MSSTPSAMLQQMCLRDELQLLVRDPVLGTRVLRVSPKSPVYDLLPGTGNRSLSRFFVMHAGHRVDPLLSFDENRIEDGASIEIRAKASGHLDVVESPAGYTGGEPHAVVPSETSLASTSNLVGMLLHAISKRDISRLRHLLVAMSAHQPTIALSDVVNYVSTDVYGWTPLHLACAKGSRAIVTLLIEYGADVTITDKLGRTPLNIFATTDPFLSSLDPFVATAAAHETMTVTWMAKRKRTDTPNSPGSKRQAN